MLNLSVKNQNLVFIYLLFSIFIINIWSYFSVYLLTSNSLKYSFTFFLFTLPVLFINPNKFINFIYKSNYRLIFILFLSFFIIDISINSPINKYKFDTYTLIYLIIFFKYIFEIFDNKKIIKFIYLSLLLWLIISLIEYYILENISTLHQLAFQGIGIQNIIFGPESYHGKGIHGLGITTQTNISAIILLIFFSIYYFVKQKNNYIKFILLLIIITSILISPYTLSLTSVLSLVLSIFFVLVRKRLNFSLSVVYFFLLIFVSFSFAIVFEIGSFFGFSARSGNESSYYYDLFKWPIEYFLDNAFLLSSGFLNEISPNTTPLENRYFNLLLSLGFFFFLICIKILYDYHSKIFSSKSTLLNNLKLFVFTYLIISYFHISYLPHTNTIILTALMFSFSIHYSKNNSITSVEQESMY